MCAPSSRRLMWWSCPRTVQAHHGRFGKWLPWGNPSLRLTLWDGREVVEDGVNGLRVPVYGVKALAQAMRSMIEFPDVRERMGKAGREKMEREFDERLVLEKTLQLYTQEAL